MLDLFAGLGGASRAMRERGWDVMRVDNDADLAVDTFADLREWSPAAAGFAPGHFDLIWASPPCQEMSLARAPKDRLAEPDMRCVEATLRIIDELRPRWWCIENVRGACRPFRPLLGVHVQSHGPVFLWGEFPYFAVRVGAYKTKVSGYDGGRRRAVTPHALSEALALACERVGALAAALPARSPLAYARARLARTSGESARLECDLARVGGAGAPASASSRLVGAVDALVGAAAGPTSLDLAGTAA